MTFSDPSTLPVFPSHHEQAEDHWREAVDGKIDQLGWRAFTKVEQPDSDITIFLIDVTPSEDTVFHPEGPATFSLSIFVDGGGTLSVDGAAPFVLKPGAAVLFACNRMTRGENFVQANQRLRVVDIRFEPTLLEKLGGVSLRRLGGSVMTEHSLPEQDVFLIGFKAPPELLAVAGSLFQCRYEPGLARQLHLYSKSIEALSIGLDAVSRSPTGKPVKPLTPEEMQKLHRAVDIIEKQYSADWTIPRLAREVGLNERRFKEAFRLEIGKSVHACLRTTRLDAAATLLEAGVSVTEAAYAVGFDNLSHFSKVFREEKGVLPSRYLPLS
ncbi:helix-turn-helix transcriptional regulator [Brucella gallinifaecis]|uniref:helix-turn-helix transcriptional regulator n=1 Tax=Brucella gallinifaecis TaxID=215590 RepID=UPI0023615503|nr:AraC family transcriptional regulator [Brucella gallinifaecis]